MEGVGDSLQVTGCLCYLITHFGFSFLTTYRAVALPLQLVAAKLCVFSKNTIKRRAKRAARIAAAVTTERATNCFRISAVLDGDAESDRGVARVHVGCAVALVVLQKHLGDTAIGEAADGCRVAQASDFDVERGRGAAVLQACARGHHRSTPSRRRNVSAWSILSAV